VLESLTTPASVYVALGAEGGVGVGAVGATGDDVGTGDGEGDEPHPTARRHTISAAGNGMTIVRSFASNGVRLRI
jgi:hypothetical protein